MIGANYFISRTRIGGVMGYVQLLFKLVSLKYTFKITNASIIFVMFGFWRVFFSDFEQIWTHNILLLKLNTTVWMCYQLFISKVLMLNECAYETTIFNNMKTDAWFYWLMTHTKFNVINVWAIATFVQVNRIKFLLLFVLMCIVKCCMNQVQLIKFSSINGLGFLEFQFCLPNNFVQVLIFT